MGAWEMGPFDNDDAESEWVALWSEGGVLDQSLAPARHDRRSIVRQVNK